MDTAAIQEAQAITDTSNLTPVEIDTILMKLDEVMARLQRQVASAEDDVHRAAGERPQYVGRNKKVWQTDLDTARAAAEFRLQAATFELDRKPIAQALARYDELQNQITANGTEFERFEAEYLRRPWPRYIGVAGGHVHSGTWCAGGTIRPTTIRQWIPALSGQSFDEAMETLKANQTILCTHCFPNAPVEMQAPAEQDTKCPGSGRSYDENLPHRTGYYTGNWAECPDCHERITVTKNGFLRKHDKKKES